MLTMKDIDESFFTQNGKCGRKAEDFLRKGEKILWRGIPKKESYIIERLKNRGISQYTPHLLVLDFIILITLIILTSDITKRLSWMFILVFLGIHFSPFYLWWRTRSIAKQEVYYTEYIITSKTKYINFSAEYKDITDIKYRQQDLDKRFKTADIYISTIGNKHIMCDIPNGLFIFEKLDTLYQMKLEEAEEFYQGYNVCSHCNSYFDKSEHKCPNCGAPRE